MSYGRGCNWVVELRFICGMLDDWQRGRSELVREAEGPEKADQREGDDYHDDAGGGKERAHCGGRRRRSSSSFQYMYVGESVEALHQRINPVVMARTESRRVVVKHGTWKER